MSGCDTPIIVITCHGIYYEEEYKPSKCNVHKLNATKVGIANYVKQDVLHTIPRAVSSALLETDCQKAVDILQEYFSCEDYYDDQGNTLATPAARESQDYMNYTSDWKKKCLYNIKKWNKADVFLNKNYQISKGDDILDLLEDDEGNYLTDESGNLVEAYDNRIVMFLNNGKKIDLLPSWNITSVSNNPMETLMKKRRTTFNITLEELINKVYQMGYSDIIIVDLSCSVCSEDSGLKDNVRALRNLNRQKRGGNNKLTRKKLYKRKKPWNSVKNHKSKATKGGVNSKRYDNVVLYNPKDPVGLGVRVFETDVIPINKYTNEIVEDISTVPDRDIIYRNINRSKLQKTFEDISNWENDESNPNMSYLKKVINSQKSKELLSDSSDSNEMSTISNDSDENIFNKENSSSEELESNNPLRKNSSDVSLLSIAFKLEKPEKSDNDKKSKKLLNKRRIAANKYLKYLGPDTNSSNKYDKFKSKKNDEKNIDVLERLEILREPSSIKMKPDEYAKLLEETEEFKKKAYKLQKEKIEKDAIIIPKKKETKVNKPGAPKTPPLDSYESLKGGNSKRVHRLPIKNSRKRSSVVAGWNPKSVIANTSLMHNVEEELKNAREYYIDTQNKKLELYGELNYQKDKLNDLPEKIDDPNQNNLISLFYQKKIDNPEYKETLKKIDELTREHEIAKQEFEAAEELWEDYTKSANSIPISKRYNFAKG